MLAVRLVVVASLTACLAATSISLTPAQPAQADTGCTAGEQTPGGSCACCI